jgi:thiazole synthase ThiGH ThiG subunit
MLGGRDAIRFAIGSNKGLKTIDFLEIIIEQSKVPVIIDAGIGRLQMLQKRWN